jgi:hypothetical protein
MVVTAGHRRFVFRLRLTHSLEVTVGSSLPPPAGIDLVSSFARCRGSDVEIVLAEPKLEHQGEGACLELRRGAVRVPATVRLEDQDGERRVVATAPRDQLRDGTWSLTISTPGAERAERVDARLLVQGRRPMVLLWGAKAAASELPTPHRARSSRQKAAAAGGAVLDRALQVLPPERARSVRASLRAVARRALR